MTFQKVNFVMFWLLKGEIQINFIIYPTGKLLGLSMKHCFLVSRLGDFKRLAVRECLV